MLLECISFRPLSKISDVFRKVNSYEHPSDVFGVR
jgi:hypothetical protein